MTKKELIEALRAYPEDIVLDFTLGDVILGIDKTTPLYESGDEHVGLTEIRGPEFNSAPVALKIELDLA